MNTVQDNKPFALTIENFQAEVLDNETPVLIDFWAQWCGPCRMMGPMFDEAAKLLAGEVRMAKLNVDEQPALAEAFGIRGIPTLVLMKGNKAIDSWSGVMPAKAIADRVRSNLAR